MYAGMERDRTRFLGGIDHRSRLIDLNSSKHPYALFFFPSVTDTLSSAEKPRAHLTGNACSKMKCFPWVLQQMLRCNNLGLYGSDRIRCCRKHGENNHQLCLVDHDQLTAACVCRKGPTKEVADRNVATFPSRFFH